MPDLSKYRKTVTAVVGAILVLGATLLPAQWNQYQGIITTVLAVLTALGVYGIANRASA